jgi:competence protein ComEC
VTAGTRRVLGGVVVTVLHPPSWQHGRDPHAEDRNNNSLVLRLDYGLASIVLAADIEEPAERQLIAAHAPLRARVLKVAHHGSRESTSAAFLSATRPMIAVISVGPRNPFGHPSAETLDRLGRAGATTYRTDQHGAVILDTDGHHLSITTWATRTTRRLSLSPG